ncbi:MAG: ParB N-terminal domain-containing protein [Erysipelotrichaceae bacterium]|nr:ParB N-terminal domain-containing protein [Erysipelotrichaceae bacterium]
MAAKTKKIDMPTVEDILGEYAPDGNETVEEILISEIDNYLGNKFPVIDNAPDMLDLIDSIRENGVTDPVPVFKKEDGRYQLCTGHRRKRACEILGKETMPCRFVPPMNDDELEVFNNDSNITREYIPIMIKAEIAVSTFDTKQRIRKTKGISDVYSDSVIRQINRYRRILTLDEDLHGLVNNEQIGIFAAEEISYVPADMQKVIAKVLYENGKKLSKSNAKMLREQATRGKLDADEVVLIITGQKRVRVRKNAKLEVSRKIQDAIPADVLPKDYEDYIFTAINFYRSYKDAEENPFEDIPSGGIEPVPESELKSKKARFIKPPKA